MTTGKQRHVIVRSNSANDTGFAKVFAFLRDQLLEGTIRSGDRLVPERDLAAQRGVSRPIVREPSQYIEARAYDEGGNGNQALFRVYDRMTNQVRTGTAKSDAPA